MARREGARALCAIPIRHYKSRTAYHAIAWSLRRDPTLRWLYMTHGDMFAQERGREIRDLCRRVGVDISPRNSGIREWSTMQGGGVRSMSAQSSALGGDVDALLVDDPFKSQEAADSEAIRDRVDATISFYQARLPPGGSVMVMMSRFHIDDAIGRRLRRTAETWEHLHERAISSELAGPDDDPDTFPDARAFAPEVRSLAYLRHVRAVERERDPAERMWWAQYQNDPHPDSEALFGPATRYTTLPTEPGWRDIAAIDMTYSERHYSDYAAVVVMRVWPGRWYIQQVVRVRKTPEHLEQVIRACKHTNGGGEWKLFSFIAASERPALAYLASKGIQVDALSAQGKSKLFRSARTRALWNAQKVLVPAGVQLEAFLNRVAAFRGVGDESDDEIDAMVACVEGSVGFVAQPTSTLGTRRI
jgi:phage terminase large subunit-like protein